MTAITLFLISAAVLALELVLVRTFSIGHWHHFSYLVISTALLGFGAGGTFVTVFPKLLTRNHTKTIWALVLGFALAVPIVFQISRKVPFDELQLIWDSRQILYLLTYYLLFFIPFFFAGSFIAFVFTAYGNKTHRLYFYNMTGSGFGAAGAVALMYGNPPERLLLIISSVVFVAALIFAFKISRLRFFVTLIIGVICLFVFSPAGPFEPKISINENKSLVYYQNIPEAENLAVRYSPMGRLDCVRGLAIRYFPGLSIAYEGSLPKQILIISDGDGITAINNFKDANELDCYRHTTSALAYHLVDEPIACIIGAGGGSDVAQALAFNSAGVTAVEMNPQIIDLVQGELSRFSAGIYNRDNVHIVIAEGRNFLQTTKQLFDIINISLLDSFTASTAGLYALNESHLYTIESIEQALNRLHPAGLLSITRVPKLPPRDSLKMLATITEALRKRGISNPSEHIVMIRGWSTATIIVSPQVLSKSQITNARKFAAENSFDLVHLPGIERKEANQFDVLEEPVYFQSAGQIFSDSREKFYDDYSYNIRPATDDRPYFFDFFRWKTLPYMIRTMGRHWLVFSEWGYLILTAILLQAVIASALFILLPLCIAKPVKAVVSGKLATLSYFGLLGLSYMFLEMGFIQKQTLLIGHPVFGVAVTLVGFLVFSGCGSLAAGRFSRYFKKTNSVIWTAVAAIILIGTAEIIFFKLSFNWLVGFSQMSKMVLGILITAPLAFFMGIPFPTVLKRLHNNFQPLVPWAWGVNGFASVTGAVLGTLLAISMGFTTLAFIALICYFMAAVISGRICD